MRAGIAGIVTVAVLLALPVALPSAGGIGRSGAPAPGHAVATAAPIVGARMSLGDSAAHGRHLLTGPLDRFPHPGPVPAAHPSYYGHYYAGTVFNGTSFNSTQLSATIQVPLDVPQSTDFYYVILSIWDNASSYDQIGFANAGGVFGVAYSTTDYCANTYYYSPNAYALTPGATYNFSMRLAQGAVDFAVVDPSGSVVWSLSQFTGGRYFVGSAFYSCYYAPLGNVTAFYDYTDYEEVYQTAGNVPPYDFFFGQNVADLSPVTAFGLFTTPPLPGPISVPISGDNAVVANEPESLALNQVNTTYTLVSPAAPKVFVASLAVADVASSGSVALAPYSVPTGWAVTLSTGSASPPSTFTVQVTVPSGAAIGNYSVGISATDSSANPNQLSVFFEVVAPLSVGVRASPFSQADVGQNVTFTAVPGGGVGGLSYVWNGLPPGCPGAVGATLHCLPTTSGSYLIAVTASDGGGDTATSPVFSFTVHPDPVVTAVASPGRVDINQSVSWYATASGGSGGFVYSWSGLISGCTATGATAVCVLRSVGTFSLTALATDAAGFTVASAPIPVEVFAAPSISLALTRHTVDVGQPVTLTANATGGTGGFSYVWTGLPGGCASTAPSATCAFHTSGTFLVTVLGYDTVSGNTPTARAYVTVSPDPVVVLTTTNASVDLGQQVAFSVRVTGGAPGADRYAFENLPTGCLAGSLPVVSCVPTAVGAFPNVTAAVTDTNNWTVRAALNFTVYSDPVATLTIAPPSAEVGTTVVFSASVSGGSGGTVYAWSNLPGGCQAAPTATIACAPGGTGSTNVTVTVTDSDGFSTNASAVLTVVPAPALLSSPWPYLGVGLVLLVGVALGLWFRRRRRAPATDA